jgi:hypothetical protein
MDAMNFERIFQGYGLEGLLIMVCLLGISHFFQWSRIIGYKLPRLLAYTIGSACIWIGFTHWWVGVFGNWIAPLMLAVVMAVAGVAVLGFYAIDKAGVWIDVNRRKNGVAK